MSPLNDLLAGLLWDVVWGGKVFYALYRLAQWLDPAPTEPRRRRA